MKRLVRMDDFPGGDKRIYDPNHIESLRPIINVLEKYEVNYLIGACPELCDDKDIDFLDKNVKSGHVCMHGFNHGWNYPIDWNRIVEIWPYGGEFINMSEEDFEKKYLSGLEKLKKISTFTEKHFIPPFNCVTQNALNILNKYECKFIHTCDQEYFKYKQYNLNFFSMKPIVAKLYSNYDFVNKVVDRIDTKEDQITLHWIYDVREVPNFIHYYEKLAQKLSKEN